MVVGFLVVAVVLMIAGALLRKGNPELLGSLIAQVAMGAADAVGLLHVVSLKRLRRAPMVAGARFELATFGL